MQSQQLPTESQVLEDEVLSGTDAADQPTEEMSERRDHGKNSNEKIRIQLLPSHSFCRCTTLWRGTGQFYVYNKTRETFVATETFLAVRIKRHQQRVPQQRRAKKR